MVLVDNISECKSGRKAPISCLPPTYTQMKCLSVPWADWPMIWKRPGNNIKMEAAHHSLQLSVPRFIWFVDIFFYPTMQIGCSEIEVSFKLNTIYFLIKRAPFNKALASLCLEFPSSSNQKNSRLDKLFCNHKETTKAPQIKEITET